MGQTKRLSGRGFRAAGKVMDTAFNDTTNILTVRPHRGTGEIFPSPGGTLAAIDTAAPNDGSGIEIAVIEVFLIGSTAVPGAFAGPAAGIALANETMFDGVQTTNAYVRKGYFLPDTVGLLQLNLTAQEAADIIVRCGAQDLYVIRTTTTC